MTTVKEQIELRDKIIVGLELAYQRLLEFKEKNNQKMVIMVDNKIVKVAIKNKKLVGVPN